MGSVMRTVAVGFMLVLGLTVTTHAADDGLFEVLGPGGAGGIFGCSASPVDPDFMLVSWTCRGPTGPTIGAGPGSS